MATAIDAIPTFLATAANELVATRSPASLLDTVLPNVGEAKTTYTRLALPGYNPVLKGADRKSVV